nr:hypothetical protein [Tanacetum cinerariifolium]GEZ33356.1 hypothetical protein [Tanacetum cinerariifolium]
MTKPYSSHRFIADCFIAGNFKKEMKRWGLKWVSFGDEMGGIERVGLGVKNGVFGCSNGCILGLKCGAEMVVGLGAEMGDDMGAFRDLLRDDMTESGAINLETITLLQLDNILEYCMHHYRNSEKDLKAWDDDFVQLHLSSLSNLEDLFQAAKYLGIDSMMDFCTQAHESMVKEGRFAR